MLSFCYEYFSSSVHKDTNNSRTPNYLLQTIYQFWGGIEEFYFIDLNLFYYINNSSELIAA